MVRMATRRQNARDWKDDDICPNIVKRIQKLTHDSRTYKAFLCDQGEYEVREGKSFLPVSLNNRTCVCGAWQISGVPCRHAIRAIIADNGDPHKYTSTWYSVVTYKQSYGHCIKSIPDQEQWPEIDMPNILPPPMKRAAGRPARNRRREEGEKDKCKRSKTVQCRNCKSFGNNARTCKGGLTKKEKKQATSKQASGSGSKSQPHIIVSGRTMTTMTVHQASTSQLSQGLQNRKRNTPQQAYNASKKKQKPN